MASDQPFGESAQQLTAVTLTLDVYSDYLLLSTTGKTTFKQQNRSFKWKAYNYKLQPIF